ncbi:hypothetical protein EG328_003464 [Venturia inaequalis]|uniref:Uncharacterized protein n=1 Tax=Venturia inaequalis TaxID=5025 RepID=A0A8H3UUP8_VENIN|nr:hypothetical protein EG328_003464 [Venturia inaequalis]
MTTPLPRELEVVKTLTAFQEQYTSDEAAFTWQKLDGCLIWPSIQTKTSNPRWQQLFIRCLPFHAGPGATAHERDFTDLFEFNPDYDPVILLQYSGLAWKGWYMQLYFRQNRNPGSGGLDRVVLVQLETVDGFEKGEGSKPSFFPPRPGHVFEEPRKPKAEAAATPNPKSSLTKLQREIADYNKPPVPSTSSSSSSSGGSGGQTVVDRPLPRLTAEGKNVTPWDELPEDLVAAGARILGMVKRDSLERRKAFRELDEMRKAREARRRDESAVEPATAREREDGVGESTTARLSKEDIATKPPTTRPRDIEAPNTPTPELAPTPSSPSSTKRKRKSNDDDDAPKEKKKKTKTKTKQEKKSRLERELEDLAPYNNFGLKELLPSSRRGNSWVRSGDWDL